MATYQTFQTVGIKEDISDIISNISPTKTPFQTSIGSESVDNTLFQWQEDSLRNVAANQQVEGADATFIAAVPTVMRNNRTQIMTEAVQVSGTLDRVSKYGRAKEMAYQMAKSAAALKRDLENAYVGTAQSASAGNAVTAATLAGYQLQIGAANITYMGAVTPITEAKLLTNLQAVYTSGADPSIIQVTPANSLVVAAFASAAGRYRTISGAESKTTTLVNVVNLYVSPFGETKVVINRFLRAGNTLVYEPDMWKKATLRPWSRETLAKTGDSTKMMLLGEFSLKHKNYLGSGIVVEQVSSGF
ncbi:DUF5309 domain-containing protein [Bradyrhizobium quebecense]|uniref:DUF5309 family protein n=1 Tax=Bradyrhizobium quebecense TaxID=2748629 RepID=A0A974AAV8_9BRAD|nr:DUF5309 family protein [Bradyrhizobium quebecense]UGA46802.1 DUF5309 domain-containing protein [Bradyrhizobium quebecense]